MCILYIYIYRCGHWVWGLGATNEVEILCGGPLCEEDIVLGARI